MGQQIPLPSGANPARAAQSTQTVPSRNPRCSHQTLRCIGPSPAPPGAVPPLTGPAAPRPRRCPTLGPGPQLRLRSSAAVASCPAPPIGRQHCQSRAEPQMIARTGCCARAGPGPAYGRRALRGRAEEAAFRRSVGAGRGGPAGTSRSSGALPGPGLQGQLRPSASLRRDVALPRWDPSLPPSPCARLSVAREAARAALRRRIREAPPPSHLKPAAVALRARL